MNNRAESEMTPLSTDSFIEFCKRYVRQYSIERMIDKNYSTVTEDFEVFVVWYSKSLKNHKGLFATSLHDKLYFEITYDGEKSVYYFDAYDKVDNRTIKTPID